MRDIRAWLQDPGTQMRFPEHSQPSGKLSHVWLQIYFNIFLSHLSLKCFLFVLGKKKRSTLTILDMDHGMTDVVHRSGHSYDNDLPGMKQFLYFMKLYTQGTKVILSLILVR